jgi:hypothetical protein
VKIARQDGSLEPRDGADPPYATRLVQVPMAPMAPMAMAVGSGGPLLAVGGWPRPRALWCGGAQDGRAVPRVCAGEPPEPRAVHLLPAHAGWSLGTVFFKALVKNRPGLTPGTQVEGGRISGLRVSEVAGAPFPSICILG